MSLQPEAPSTEVPAISYTRQHPLGSPLIWILSFALMTATFQKTFWYVAGVRVFLSDVAIVAFICAYILRKALLNETTWSLVSKEILLINTPLLFVIIASYFVGLMTQDVNSVVLFVKGFVSWLLYLMFQAIAIDAMSRTPDSKQLYYPAGFLIGGLISVVYAAAQVFFLHARGVDLDAIVLQRLFGESWHAGIEEFGGLYRVSGLLADPNHLGIVVNVCVAIAVGFFLQTMSRKIRGVLVIALAGLFLALLFTFSRSSVIALVIAAMIAFSSGRWSVGRLMMKLSVIALFVACLGALLYYQGETLLPVIGYKLDLSGSEAVAVREALYGKSLDVWLANGWNLLLGVGFNNYASAYYAVTGVEKYNAHNTWLTYLVELGFMGFLAYVATCVYVLRIAYLTMKSRHPLFAKWGTVYLAWFTGVMAANLFYNTLGWNYAIAFQVLILGLGARVVATRRLSPEARPRSHSQRVPAERRAAWLKSI